MKTPGRKLGRRRFLAVAAGATGAAAYAQADDKKVITQASVPNDPNAPKEQTGTVPPSLPFDAPIEFQRHEPQLRVKPFSLTQVRLLPSPFLQAQEANRSLLHRYSPDRLLHNFRINAGLPSSALPLGGWEKPDCELRGHFVGHYLSACALMYAATGDQELKAKVEYMVAELGNCQQRLGQGYLSAFPVELFVRLQERKPVWAPFYTYHKILAGMLDVHEHCGSAQALTVAEDMAQWADAWSARLPSELMQMVLDEEYGGMNEALYNLAAVTSDPRYVLVGDRFTKKRFFNPLALRQDHLRGLHTNTHIPQVMGAARRYELSSDVRFHDVAEAFWTEVTQTRTYVTGGTSNNEGWLTEPNHLAEELSKGVDTNECCCAYNMLKLARKLYTWSGDPRIFEYYERVLYNHRLGTIDTRNGHSQYYLGIVPGSWRTFATEDNSFWCCNGTGVEEYSKLGDSVYFSGPDGSLFVNLFIPSELKWAERGLTIRQTNEFPLRPETRIEIHAQGPQLFALHVRVPSWVQGFATVTINGKPAEISAAGGGYVALKRTWQSGDVVLVTLPMSVRVERMPDDADLQAFVYGPLVLASRLEPAEVPENLVVGHMGPTFKKQPPADIPTLRAQETEPDSFKRSNMDDLVFRLGGSANMLTFVPFNSIPAGQRYSIYWKVL
jgi:DUF1680 family protein